MPPPALGAALVGIAAIATFTLFAVLRTLAALTASATELRRAAAAVVVCADAVVRACNEVEPLARDIRLDVEATRETVKQPLAKTTGALKKVTDDLDNLKTTLLVSAASAIAAASAFLAL